MSDLVRHFSFDPRPESYAAFLHPEWAKSFLELAEGTRLEVPAFDLVRNWDAASNARALPHIMVQCVKIAGEQMIRSAEPIGRRKIRILVEKLVAALERKGERLRPMLKRHIQEVIEEVDREFDEVADRAKETVINAQPDLWGEFLGQNDFVTSLWSLERLCYSSLYYNYEWFLTECIRIKRGDSNHRLFRHDDFKKDFRDAFGTELQQQCWSDQRIVIARYVRHALVHNGGRITNDLRKQPHDLLLNGDEIQVGAPHTNDLFALLSKKVHALAEGAVRMSEFKK